MENVLLVVFDVGGTIIEDRGHVPSALLSALSDHGIAASPDEIQKLRGSSKQKLISTLMAQRRGAVDAGNDERVEKVYARFQDLLEQALMIEGVKAIEGACAAISALRERDIAVAVTTGFSRRIADLVLTRAGLRKLIDVVVTDDDVSMGRPAPFMIFRAMELAGVVDVHGVVNVGDTPLDLKAGHNAGVAGRVGVLTGPYSAEELAKHPHTHILPSVASLPQLIVETRMTA